LRQVFGLHKTKDERLDDFQELLLFGINTIQGERKLISVNRT